MSKARNIDRSCYTAEIIGPARKCQLWINGALYQKDINGIGTAQRLFASYWQRRATRSTEVAGAAA